MLSVCINISAEANRIDKYDRSTYGATTRSTSGCCNATRNYKIAHVTRILRPSVLSSIFVARLESVTRSTKRRRHGRPRSTHDCLLARSTRPCRTATPSTETGFVPPRVNTIQLTPEKNELRGVSRASRQV